MYLSFYASSICVLCTVAVEVALGALSINSRMTSRGRGVVQLEKIWLVFFFWPEKPLP